MLIEEKGVTNKKQHTDKSKIIFSTHVAS